MSTAMTRQEIEEKIIARAWQDTSFKQVQEKNKNIMAPIS